MGRNMGVFSEIARIEREIVARGNRFYETEWRKTGAGAVTYELLAYNGEILPYYVVPSTFGTHPHVIFEIPKNINEVVRVMYNRSTRGATNELKVELCKVVAEDGRVRLEPIKTLYVKVYPSPFVANLDQLKVFARVVSKATKLAEELGGLTVSA